MADDTDSTRLRDQATTAFQQQRQQASDTSTRLRDRATTAFQQGRERFKRRREAINDRREQFAGALDLSAEMIDPIQLDERGNEVGFVPDSGGRELLAERFAADRQFVDVDDTLVEADPRKGVRPRTDPDRLDDIAEDAASEFAGADQFAEPGDFDVEVGPGGVTDARLSETGARRRASRQLTAETPLDAVDPTSDIRPTSGGGFELTDTAARRSAARRFEDDFGAIGQGSLDPTSDVRQTDTGFGLAEGPAREVAAAQLDEEVPEVDIGPDDISLELGDDGSYDAAFEGEVRR